MANDDFRPLHDEVYWLIVEAARNRGLLPIPIEDDYKSVVTQLGNQENGNITQSDKKRCVDLSPIAE
jgi:hypothetical protein